MSLDPLLQAPAVIQIHTALALSAVALTLAILTLRKGSPLHRAMGRAWVVAMAIVAVSSFWIHELRVVGLFSPIHLLSLVTLWTLLTAVGHARAGRIAAHRRQMRFLIFGALVVAGAFTFVPGRIMHTIVSGG